MPIDPEREADEHHPAASAVLIQTRNLIVTIGGILLLLVAAVGLIELQVQDQARNVKANARAAETNANANAETRKVAERIDHTLTSIVDQFTKAAADPANVAATLRSRQRVIITCETNAAIAARLGLDVTPCPAEPTTTTTTIGPPAPDS